MTQREEQQTVCGYCLRPEGHSRRCSVAKYGAPEYRLSAVVCSCGCDEVLGYRYESTGAKPRTYIELDALLSADAIEAFREAYLMTPPTADKPERVLRAVFDALAITTRTGESS